MSGLEYKRFVERRRRSCDTVVVLAVERVVFE